MTTILTALCFALATPAAPPSSTPSSTVATAEKLRDRALAGQSVAYDVVESLTTEVGARPTGSPAMVRAKDWALAKLKKLGFKNVRAEEFIKENAWLRGPESASITAPYAQTLAIIGLGNTTGTPPSGVEAEIRVFAHLDLLAAEPPGALAGKIAVVNQPMVRTQTGEGYGPAVRVRGVGPKLAAERGAVAFLMRSVSTSSSRAPHTGGTNWGAGPSPIPAAALGVADADLLERLAARGPVKVALKIEPVVVKQTPAWNIVGEIPGRGDGLIVIGGHLDSWDAGQGAQDDGAGVAITVAAAKLVADHAPRMKRTIRVVLFGSEETGGSSDAFVAAHKAEIPRMALAAESDLGSGRIFKVALPKGGASASSTFPGLAPVLAPLGVFIATDPAKHAGSDIEGLQEAGVPVIEIRPDASRYFDVHHSDDDTLDKIVRADLDQAVAVWAVMLAFIADSDVDLR